ncbi:caspase family protein [Catenuloplanes japonicus]|uniref:caspase family protein n=1 Tax=Catenuloplanes japonicus TaxID=33876 RepID=UPI0005243B13|nr:caspase family protein [Catenuloplanes japonicus]
MTEVFVPADWADRKPGPKHWTEDARGDDPAAREVHAPTGTGIGDGKVFLFLFGYKTAGTQDPGMMAAELDEIDDDVAVLREAGYTVVVDRQATREDMRDAVTGRGLGDLVPAGIYWSSHGGADGSVECCDGTILTLADIPAAHEGLRLLVLGACYVGAYAPAWRTALGGHPLVAGWGRPVTLQRAIDFLEEGRESDVGLDDLIKQWMLTDAPIPPNPANAESGLAPAAVTTGRIGRLKHRMPAIGERLGAGWAEHDNHVDITVPLPGGRTHVVQMFLVDGTDPFAEGVTMCGMEADVGPTSPLITPEKLLAASGHPGYGRVALVTGPTGVPQIVTQSFTPLAGTSTQQLAARCYQVALHADTLEYTVFGIDES